VPLQPRLLLLPYGAGVVDGGRLLRHHPRRGADRGPRPAGDLGVRLARRRAEELAYFLLILVFMAPVLFVFFWMISVSFRNNLEATAFPPVFVPQKPTLAGYEYVFKNPNLPFGQYILNSTVVALGCTALGMLLGVPAAFSIA